MRLLIKEWRQARRLTQTQLARSIGMSPSQLSRYETDSRRLSAWHLLELATVLQITPDMLFPGHRDALVQQLLERHMPDDDMREVVREHLEDIEADTSDTPLEQQVIYHSAIATRAWSDTLWYLIVSRQAVAAQETRRLQQALTQQTNEERPYGHPHG